ncbi:MAG: hypothetical protein R3A48_15385 [Polyangiales bacterium]
MTRSTVAALRARPETVLDDLERLCALAGMPEALAGAPGVTLTCGGTPWQLDGVARALRDAGASDLDALPPRGPSARRRALAKVLRAQGIAPRDPRAPPVEVKPRARMHALPKGFPEGLFVPEGVAGRGAAQLGDLDAGAMPCALALLGDRAHRVEPWRDRALVDLLAVQRELHPGLFAVLDGTLSHGGLLLASRDLVALDAVAARLAGVDPGGVERLRLAHEDGLGVADPRDIRLVGDALSDDRWNTNDLSRSPSPPPRGSSALRRFFSLPPFTRLRSEVDALRDGLRARGRLDGPWGRLFERYALTGAAPG